LIEICSDLGPTMCFSGRRYIDGSGAILETGKKLRGDFKWNNSIIQNVAPGNTILLNPQAVELVKSFGAPDVKHYDSWIYLVMSLFGEILYLPEDLISYRLHGKNSVGLRSFKDILRLPSRVSDYLMQLEILQNQIEVRQEFVLPPQLTTFIKGISSGKLHQRLKSALLAPVKRESLPESQIVKLVILILQFRKQRT